MAKEKKTQKSDSVYQEKTMTAEEAKSFRSSLYKPTPKVLSEVQKREAFRIFWTSNKSKYGRSKTIEKALWLHLKTLKMDTPEQFAQGLANFGLKKVK